MSKLSTKKYEGDLANAVRHFWQTRRTQKAGKKKTDQGNRSAVTGGKQLDGFVNLLTKVAIDAGVPAECIFTKGSILPGYFRPTKNWDFIIVSPFGKLIAVIEFKSHVGSFGNNFNNRTEEALGSAVDLWTAFREQSFPQTTPPWIGYLMLAEKTNKSIAPVKIRSPHFQVREEFTNKSYLERYLLFCQKLMLEKHYSSTCLIWSESENNFGSLDSETSINSFLLSFMGFLQGKINDFKK